MTDLTPTQQSLLDERVITESGVQGLIQAAIRSALEGNASITWATRPMRPPGATAATHATARPAKPCKASLASWPSTRPATAMAASSRSWCASASGAWRAWMTRSSRFMPGASAPREIGAELTERHGAELFTDPDSKRHSQRAEGRSGLAGAPAGCRLSPPLFGLLPISKALCQGSDETGSGAW